MLEYLKKLFARTRHHLSRTQPTSESSPRSDEWRIQTLTPTTESAADAVAALQLIGERGNRNGAFHLYIPAHTAHQAPMPLLVMLHGCRQNADSFAQGTRMNRLADRHGFAVLYPEQSLHANPMGCWNWFSQVTMSGAGEAAMLVRMIDLLITRYAFDSRRVYVAGMSAGGAMARVLAVCYPHLFAACASHSGVMYRAAASGLQAFTVLKKGSRASPVDTARRAARVQSRGPRFVPTLIIQGMADEIVNPVNAAQTLLQAETLAKADGFHGMQELTIQREAAGRPYSLREQCTGGVAMIREVLVKDLRHAWSGGDDSLPFNDAHGPDASAMIWEFVSQHQR